MADRGRQLPYHPRSEGDRRVETEILQRQSNLQYLHERREERYQQDIESIAASMDSLLSQEIGAHDHVMPPANIVNIAEQANIAAQIASENAARLLSPKIKKIYFINNNPGGVSTPRPLPTPPQTPSPEPEATIPKIYIINNNPGGIPTPRPLPTPPLRLSYKPAAPKKIYFINNFPGGIDTPRPGQSLIRRPGLKLRFKVNKNVRSPRQHRLRLRVAPHERFSKAQETAFLNRMAAERPYWWGRSIHPYTIENLTAQGVMRELHPIQPALAPAQVSYPQRLINEPAANTSMADQLNTRRLQEIARATLGEEVEFNYSAYREKTTQ